MSTRIRKKQKTSRLSILLLLTSLFIFSCEKPMDNPEQVDKIYNDLLADAKVSSSAAETEKKNLESIEKDIAALKSGDNTAKTKFRQKFESETKIESFHQKANYFTLRAFKRKEYVLDHYPNYFKKHLPWPDEEEWKDYQASKRLQMASRDWDQRVPKLGKRIKDYSSKATSEYSPSPKAEGKKSEPKEKPSEGAPSEESASKEKSE